MNHQTVQQILRVKATALLMLSQGVVHLTGGRFTSRRVQPQGRANRTGFSKRPQSLPG
ncbi:MAG: hypothetical protein ACI9ZF_002701 [Bradyrhizobium sp.]|jgi:hypothetical protein